MLLFVFASVSAQEVSITRGNIVKDRIFLRDKGEITTSDGNGNFVSVRPKKDNGTIYTYFVEFYDNLNFRERIEIINQHKVEILKIFLKNEKLYLFIREEYKKGFALKFDIINIKNKDKTQKEVLRADKETNPELYKSLKDDYNISLNYSSKYIVSVPVVKDNTLYVFTKVFSDELEELYQYKTYPDKVLPYKNTKYFSTSQFDNNVYHLFNVTLNEGKNLYRLIELNDNESRALDIPIKDNIYELVTSKIKKSNFIICGLYSMKRRGGFEGITYHNIDLESFSVSFQKLNTFSNNQVSKYFKGFFKNNRSLDIKNILIDENLNAYLVSQLYIIRKQTAPIGIPIATIGSSILITYNPINAQYKMYDDLLICKINTEGTLDWDNILEIQEIIKTSSRSNKNDSSIFSFLQENKVNVLVNGYVNPKAEKVVIKQEKRFSKTNLYNLKINEGGTMFLKKIFSYKDSEILFRAEKTTKSDNILYNLGQGNMRKQLLKIEL